MYAAVTPDVEANYPTSLLFAAAPAEQAAASGGAGKGHMALQQIARPHAAEPNTMPDGDENDAAQGETEPQSHTLVEGGQDGEGEPSGPRYFPVQLFLAAVGDGELIEPEAAILNEPPREFPQLSELICPHDHSHFDHCNRGISSAASHHQFHFNSRNRVSSARLDA